MCLRRGRLRTQLRRWSTKSLRRTADRVRCRLTTTGAIGLVAHGYIPLVDGRRRKSSAGVQGFPRGSRTEPSRSAGVSTSESDPRTSWDLDRTVPAGETVERGGSGSRYLVVGPPGRVRRQRRAGRTGLLPGGLTRGRRLGVLGLFLLLVGVYGITSGGHVYNIDEEVMFQTTRSLLHGEPALRTLDPNHPLVYRERPDGSYAGQYGIAQSVLAVPLYVLGSGLARLAPPEQRDFVVRTTTFMANSLVTPAIAVVVLLSVFELTRRWRLSVLVALSYALCTYAWPHAKTFASEPGTSLCVIASVYLAFRYRATGRLVLLGASASVAVLAVMFRVSALVFVPLVGMFLIWAVVQREGVRRIPAAAAVAACWVAPMILVLGLVTWWRFGDPLASGYGDSVPLDYPFVEGFVNQLVSPGKSLLLFAPLGVVAVLGIYRSARHWLAESLLLSAVILANLALFARTPWWGGDASWGGRYGNIILPALAVLAGLGAAGSRVLTRGLVGLSVFGLLVPALLGVLLSFHMFLVRVGETVGGGRVSPVTRHEIQWQPQLGHLELLPEAVRDVLDERRPGDRTRGTYTSDPVKHYGYFASAPRIDFWWLWVGPTGSSPVVFVLLVPLLGSGVGGAVLLLQSFRPVPAAPEVPPGELRSE